MAGIKEKKHERIELRATVAQKRILQEAAEVSHADLSQFVLQASLTEAEILLSSRTRFVLSEEQWNRFGAALEAPPTPRPALHRLLNEPSVLER